MAPTPPILAYSLRKRISAIGSSHGTTFQSHVAIGDANADDGIARLILS